MSFILYQKRSWDSPNVALNRKVKLGVDLRSFSVVGRFLFYAASIALSSLGFGGQRPPKMKGFHFVYILKCDDGYYYTGCTKDLDDRLSRHHRGSVPATKDRRPVTLISYLAFSDKYKDFAYEKYLKTGSGKAVMLKRFV